MTKKKMAVKNKSKFSQLRLNFEGVNAVKSVTRSLFAISLIAGIAFLGFKTVSFYEQIWPVKQVLLESEPKYLNKASLIQLVKQQAVQGMLAIDLSEIQQQVKKLDWVKNVEVRKVWPDILIFTIVENQPVAAFGKHVLTRQGSLIEGDSNNSHLTELPKIDMQITAEKNDTIYSNVWSEYKQVKRQFELLNLEVALLQVDALNNWQLSFTNGLKINLGRKSRRDRIARLLDVYSQIDDKKKIKKIDLRYLNGIAIEWKTETESQIKG